MSRLIKPSEYAKQSGISRQAVYAKIKKGLLKSKKIDGQIFIELDSSININSKTNENIASTNNTHKDLLLAKDETIKILKNTIEDLKATNNLIIGTLKGEVDLLKEAFGEMQQLYRTQIEHLQIRERPKLERNKLIDEKNYIDIKELARVLDLDKTQRKRFKKVATKLHESGDFRFTLIENELYALKNADYSDFLKLL